MQHLISIFKNSTFLGIATVLDRGGEYLLVLYIARAFGVEFLGDYTLVLALTNIFQRLGSFGLNQLIMRQIARKPSAAGNVLINYALVSGGLGVFLLTVMYVTINLLSYQGTILLALYVAGASLLPAILRGVAEATISALERMEYITLVSLSGSILRVTGAILLLSRGGSLPAIFWMLVLSQSLVCVLYAILIHFRLGRIRLQVNLPYCWDLMPSVGNFFLMSIFLVGANHIDAVMLSKLADQEAVGLYGAAFKLVQAVILFRPAILQALFPSLSAFFVSAPDKFRQLTESSIKFFIGVLVPVAMIITIWADQIVTILYGKSFLGASLTLRTLIWVILPSYIYATLTRSLVASNNEKPTIVVAAISMISNVVFDVLLIPILGPTGAAISSLITMSLASALAAWCIYRNVFAFDFRGIFLKPLGLVGMVSIAVYSLLPVSALMKTLIWLVLYVIVLFVTGLLSLQMLVRSRALLSHLLSLIGSSRS
jgi:O-antigen/teichoic acid export membrane protein